MNPIENPRLSEMLRQVSGLGISTKTLGSSSELAGLVAVSGIEKVFDKFNFNIKERLGKLRYTQDYQMIIRVGEHEDMYEGNLFVPGSSRFKLGKQPDGFVAINLTTFIKDNFGRAVDLNIGLNGVSLPDKMLGFALFTKIFPSLKFQEFESQPSDEEIKRLIADNIVPHPILKLNS